MANEGWYGRTILVSNMSWDSPVSIVSGHKLDDQGEGIFVFDDGCYVESIFRCILKIARSDCWLHCVCPSTWNSWTPTGRILMYEGHFKSSAHCTFSL